MTMGPGGDLKLKLSLDTSAVVDDLRAVDQVLRGLEQRMVAAYNRSQRVRKGAISRAFDYQDIPQGAYRTPEMRQIERHMERRAQELQRAAQRGETSAPPTQRELYRQQAQQRLSAAARPTEITAKQKFFDDMVTSLRRGLASAPAMAAAQTGIPGASGLARTLMGLAGDNPLVAGGLGAAVAVGAGALAVSAERARFQRQQASLASALVGGPAFGDTRTMLGLGVMAAAQQMSTSKEEGGAIAYQLASAGMGQGQATQNMQTVLGMTKGYGLQTSDVEPLVAALGTAGGMSASQIKQTFSDVVDASGKATGSIQQTTKSLVALSAVNAIAARDAFGAAAVQRAVGPTSGINAGQLMAPAMGATGAGALAAAAFLGMSPEEFLRDQATKGGMAKIYDRVAASARSFGSDTTGTLIAEQVLGPSGMNLLNWQGVSATQQAAQIRRMQTQRPGQAFADYQRAARAPRPRRPSPATLAGAMTSPWDQFWLGFGNLFTQVANQPHAQTPPSFAASSGGAPLPLMFPLGGGKSGLHTVPAGLASQVAAAVSAGARASDTTHTVKIDVTVRDQRGNQLGHKVDTTRVIAGANTTNRPPYDHPGRSSPPPWTGGGTGGHGSGGGSSGFD